MILASLLVSIAIQSAPQAADFLSSRAALRAPGTIEANGFLRSDLAVKKAALALVLGIADHEAEKRSKTLVWIIRGGEAIGYGLVVRHNLRLANGR